VSRKFAGALLLTALAMSAPGQPADATLLSLPKSLNTSPLDGVEMNLSIWGPSAQSVFCIEHLSACQPQQPKKVALFSLPKSLKQQFDRVPHDRPALGPMAHTMFCLKYPKDCEVRRIAFRGSKLELTAERLADLMEVNNKVNRGIKPERNRLGLAGEKWLISPAYGDCNDYAVTKRHELLERGWPSRTLLLAEVVVPSGEHHLVVVARTKQGDFVLDNLSSKIRPWNQPLYRWVRIQSAANPKYWLLVKSTGQSV